MSNIVSPYEELLSVIDGLENELIEYKKSPKVVEYVVKKRSELIKELDLIIDEAAGQENIYRLNLKIQLFRIIKDIEFSKSDRKEVVSFIKVVTTLTAIQNLREGVENV